MAWKRTFLWCPLLLLVSAGGQTPDEGTSRDVRLCADIGQAQFAREEKLLTYTASERYLIRNTHFSDPAEVVVSVIYKKDAGKVYRVISRRGPSILQSTVMDRVLKEETAMSRGEARKQSLVIGVNYSMKWLGEEVLDGRRCDVVAIEPRKKSPHLLRGRAWVDAVSHNLIRIEGKPTASPSFWVGTPQVVREYREIGGFSFAMRSHAVSQTFLLGRTELNIEYGDYRVNSMVDSTAGK